MHISLFSWVLKSFQSDHIDRRENRRNKLCDNSKNTGFVSFLSMGWIYGLKKSKTETLWKKMESRDYVEKKKDQIMKLMWRDWKERWSKSTKPLQFEEVIYIKKKKVSSHCWPFMKYWNWLRGFCGLDYTWRCTKLPNKQSLCIFHRLLTYSRGKIQSCFL